MKATSDQVALVLSHRRASVSINRLAKLTKLPPYIVRDALWQIEREECAFFAAQDRADKYSRLITFQRPLREQERGRSRGQVGTATSDRAPVPQSLSLLRFLTILTSPPSEPVSRWLPMSEWTEG